MYSKRPGHDVAWEADGPYAAVALYVHTLPHPLYGRAALTYTHPSPPTFLLYTIMSMPGWSNDPV